MSDQTARRPDTAAAEPEAQDAAGAPQAEEA